MHGMVLILVLVEHTLGAQRNSRNGWTYDVLILVLVEHTLGVHGFGRCDLKLVVLILVLVEHTLGVHWPSVQVQHIQSLNPCFSGTYSRSLRLLLRLSLR